MPTVDAPRTSTLGESTKGVGAILFALALLGAMWAGWDVIDSQGWIPHTVQTKISAKENWFVGETKECSSYALDRDSAKVINKPVGSVVEQIDCDDGPLHQVSITFWGRTEQDHIAAATWNCKRQSSEFTCLQTGTIARGPAQSTMQNGSGSSQAGDPDWRDICNNARREITLSGVREYAARKGISPNVAAEDVGKAGCGIVNDPAQ